MRIVTFLMAVILSGLMTGAFADDSSVSWYKKTEKQTTLRVDLFLSTTCPHCHKADAFFKKLQTQKPWLEVHRYFINTDKEALETFSDYLDKQPKAIDAYGVPAFFFCKTQWVGFAEEATTGQKLLQALEYCHDEIEKSGSLTPEVVKTIQQWSSASWYEGTITGDPAVWYFIPGMSLMDALNPCAVFCMLTLLSLLLLQNSTSQKIALALLFVVGMTVVHYLQQMYTSWYYEWLIYLRIPAAAVGLMMMAYAVLSYVKNKRFDAATVIAASAFVAIVLQAYQQNCVPNFALIFQQWLSGQSLTPSWQALYQAIYQLGYVLALALVTFLLYRAITHWKSPRYQHTLKQIAKAGLLLTGAVLLIYPQWLANLSFSFAILFLSIVVGWLLARLRA